MITVIERISKKTGNPYYQIPYRKNEEDEATFIPAFIKKGHDTFTAKEKSERVDTNGVKYVVYTVLKKDVFFAKNEEGNVEKAILLR